MNASEWEWADDPEDVEAPRADHRIPADERVESHARDGALELRSARRGEWVTCANPTDLAEYR